MGRVSLVEIVSKLEFPLLPFQLSELVLEVPGLLLPYCKGASAIRQHCSFFTVSESTGSSNTLVSYPGTEGYTNYSALILFSSDAESILRASKEGAQRVTFIP